MNDTLYYGEIVARIAGQIHQNPEHLLRINYTLSQDNGHGDTIWTLCADAGRVFDKIEDLSGEHHINWYKALDIYAGELLDYLLGGSKPHIIDMVSLVVRSLEQSEGLHVSK